MAGASADPARRRALVAIGGALRVAGAVSVYGCAGLGGLARAHELPGNRLTVVRRDDLHLSLTLFLDDAPQALQLILEPGRPLREFVLAHAALTPAQLQGPLRLAGRRLAEGTRVSTLAGQAWQFTGWEWPAAEQVSRVLQQRAMQAVVAPGEHAHDGALELRAQARTDRAGASVSVTLPRSLGRVLVVAYRPSQAWVEPGAASPALRF